MGSRLRVTIAPAAIIDYQNSPNSTRCMSYVTYVGLGDQPPHKNTTFVVSFGKSVLFLINSPKAVAVAVAGVNLQLGSKTYFNGFARAPKLHMLPSGSTATKNRMKPELEASLEGGFSWSLCQAVCRRRASCDWAPNLCRIFCGKVCWGSACFFLQCPDTSQYHTLPALDLVYLFVYLCIYLYIYIYIYIYIYTSLSVCDSAPLLQPLLVSCSPSEWQLMISRGRPLLFFAGAAGCDFNSLDSLQFDFKSNFNAARPASARPSASA